MGIIDTLDNDNIYGFMTITFNKIIMIISKTENRAKEIIRTLYEIQKS